MHSFIKFQSTSIKPYFIDNQEPVPDSLTFTQVFPAEVTPKEISQTKPPSADILLIKLVAKPPLAAIVLLGPVKQDCEQPKKYPEQANITALSDICFLMDDFDVIINKNANAQLV